ncbi:MAG: ABC transporter permease [Phycisphaerales bacterium]
MSNETRRSSPTHRPRSLAFGAPLLLAKKDLHAIAREKTALIFTVFFPLFIGIAFGLIFSGGGGNGVVSMLVSDADRTDASERFVELLSEHEPLEITAIEDAAHAEAMVRGGEAPAALLIAPGFGEAINTVVLGEPPSITLLIDPARRAERPMIEGMLAERSMALLAERMGQPETRAIALREVRRRIETAPGISGIDRMAWLGAIDQMLRISGSSAGGDRNAGDEAAPAGTEAAASSTPAFRPIDTEVRVVRSEGALPPSAFHVTFAMAMVWAIMGCAATFAVSLVTERTGGTLLRLAAAPIPGMSVVAGKTLACFIASLCVAGGMLLVGMLGFGIRPVAPLSLLIAIPASGAAFAGIMMLLSVLGSNKSSASQMAWAAMLLIAVPGGGMLPLIAMPGWLAAIGRFSPMRWAILAIEGGLWRGLTLAELAPIVAVLLAFAGGCFALGTMMFRLSGDPR